MFVAGRLPGVCFYFFSFIGEELTCISLSLIPQKTISTSAFRLQNMTANRQHSLAVLPFIILTLFLMVLEFRVELIKHVSKLLKP